MPQSDNRIGKLATKLRQFAEERDWEQFHSPKNLAMALSVEVAEIMEILQWISGEESRNLSNEDIGSLSEEIGDVAIYLIRLADVLGVDLIESAEKKLLINGEKYPVEKARGNAKKYTEFK